jgi:hypothetical protein
MLERSHTRRRRVRSWILGERMEDVTAACEAFLATPTGAKSTMLAVALACERARGPLDRRPPLATHR